MASATRRPGFTMIELLGVIVIIGLLMTFVLVAAQGAARDAQREQTRATIVKLENAMNQLMEAVQSSRVTPTNTHIAWATIITPAGQVIGSANDKAVLQRAQVLANYDEMRAQVPDTFWVQDSTLAQPYPLNFAQQAFLTGNNNFMDYVLPLGTNTLYNLTNGGTTQILAPTPGTGIYGASYGAAAGLYKNLGNVPLAFAPPGIVPTQALPQGSDGVDNDQDANKLIDNIGEAYIKNGNPDANIQASIIASLQQHKHNTARAEMLYALLVEGQSQFGAFLNKDDFTSGEIKDTDNDGLPEFVDAWGKPIQFFRWPVFYHSDVQRGIPQDPNALGPYLNTFETREQSPGDPNQQLMAVSWWSGTQNGGPNALIGNPPASQGFVAAQAFQGGNGSLSGPAFMFQNYFQMLVEPFSANGAQPQFFWDRSPNFFQRRAYYSRFLILSGGPDGLPGVPILSEQSFQALVSGGNPAAVSSALRLEGQAAQWDLVSRLSSPQTAILYGPPFQPSSSDSDDTSGLSFFEMGLDDISNHNLNSTVQVSAQ